MPIRLLREGILSSDRIELLDWPAEVFYRRLMSKVDDFGLFDARPSILRSSLYPLRVDRVREADIARWIAACETAGVIALYVHGGKPYGQMLDTEWQTRSEPKQPLPPWGKGKYQRAHENTCEQPKTSAHLFGDVVVDVKEKCAAPSGAGLFEEFWKAYPKKKAKDDAQKAFAKRKPDRALLAAMLDAIAAQAQTADWLKDAGQFIPYPATWLNDGRWQDEITVLASSLTVAPAETVEQYTARMASEKAKRESEAPQTPEQRAAVAERLRQARANITRVA